MEWKSKGVVEKSLIYYKNKEEKEIIESKGGVKA